MEGHRAQRVAETLREELAEIINYELSDPRLRPVSVTEVLLPAGARQAHVRLALDGTAEEQERSLQIIQAASGYIKNILVERLDVFRLPDLKFFADISPSTRGRTDAIFRRIKRGRPRQNEATESPATSPERKNPGK